MAWQSDMEVMTQRMSLPPKTPVLDLVLPEHPMQEGDSESSDEYCEETDTYYPLAELLEQFCQPMDHFAIYHSPIHTNSRTVAAHR